MEIEGSFPLAGETTGRSLVLFADESTDAGLKLVQEAMGLEVAVAGDESRRPATAARSCSSRSAWPSSTRRPSRSRRPASRPRARARSWPSSRSASCTRSR